jgi:CRISPR/Cas system-associated endonuclease Cas1
MVSQESDVLENTNLDFTQELHRIRAHLLHYTDLLEDFKKTVIFVRDMPYPALDNEEYFTPKERQESIDLMNRECKNILDEIDRLEMTRRMQDKRLTNVMQLVSRFLYTC